MNQGKLGQLTFALLDYERPREASTCLDSIANLCRVPHQIVYVSNGGKQDYVRRWQDLGYLDTVIYNHSNLGCGIATKQAITASLTRWVIYVQIDQFMCRPFEQEEFDLLTRQLSFSHSLFYIDLAGNQGHGKFSERALLIDRNRYLSIPGIDEVIGGPGPFAQSKWTEQHVQEYMRDAELSFRSVTPQLFGDNGKNSIREYGEEYGGKTLHETDTKKLKILMPFKKRADGFPNLKLNDEEWRQVLAGEWPIEGKIPEADKAHSFKCWEGVL